MKSLMTIAADGSRSRFRRRAFLSLAFAALAALALYLALTPGVFAHDLTIWTDLHSNSVQARGIWSDGETMWVVDNTDTKIYAYKIHVNDAETGWVWSEPIPGKDFDTLSGAGMTAPEGLWSDGKTMWVSDYYANKIFAFKMTDMTRDTSKEFSVGTANATGLWSDGEIMWVADETNNKIFAYELDDSDGDGTRNERIPGRDINVLYNGSPKGLWSDGVTMWVAEGNRVYSYNLSNGSIDHAMHIGWPSVNQNTHDDENIFQRGVWSDGVTMWVSDINNIKRLYAYNLPLYKVDGVRVPRPFGNRIVIEWNEAPRGDRYRVQWKLPSETWPEGDMRDPNNEMVVNRLNTPSATIAALCGKTYDVRVRTESGGGGDMDKGPWSDPVREIFTCEWTDAGTISRSYARSGNWRDSSNTGTYGSYANYYTFELTERKEVRIALSSSDTIVDPHFGRIPKFRPLLFLRGGGAIAGGWVAQSENSAVTDIYRVLDAGTYTVEVTNLEPGETGRFSFSIDTRTLTDPPATTGDVPATCETVTLTKAGTYEGKWGPGPSPHEWRCTSIDSDVGGYTRFYDFFLERRSSVTITLESDHATPRVFLREGGNSRHSTYPPYVGQYSAGDSRIRATLEPGAYTIEAAANESGHRGEFTLKVAGSGIVALEALMPLPAAVSCDATTGKTLTAGQTVNGQWGPGCERSDLPTRPDLRPCTGPGCVFSGLRTTAYTRYYDFNLPEEGGWKRVTITLTNNDKLPPDLKLREAGQPNAHSRYLAYGEESGSKASRIVMDLAPGNYVIEALNLDYPDPFFAKTGQFTIGYTTSAPRVDCGRDIPGTGEVEDHWFTECRSSVQYGYARFFTFTVPGGAGDDVKQTIKVNTYGQVPSLFPALWLRAGDDNRTGGYLAQANGLRHRAGTHYSSTYGYSQLISRAHNITELSVNLAPGKYTVEVATGVEATGHFRLNLGQGDATGSGLTALHQIPNYNDPAVRDGSKKPEGVSGASDTEVPDTVPTVTDASQFKTHYFLVGQSVSLTLPAADEGSGNGGPYDYNLWHRGTDKSFADQAINGLSFDPLTRTLSGTPEAEGTWELSYMVHDGDGDRNSADAFRENTNLEIVVEPDGTAVGGSPPQQSQTDPENRAPNFDANIDTTLEVPENSPAGTNVGSPITATDPDDDPLTYSLSGTDVAAFSIGATTGQIATVDGVTYDYEAKSSYSLVVTAADGRGPSVSTPATVNLTDVSEFPEFHEGTSTTRQVAENSAAGIKVGLPVTAFDSDGDTLSYIGTDGADGAAFALDEDTGQLTTVDGVTYDYETKSSYQFMVVVMETESDEGYLSGISVTVSLTDVAEGDSGPEQSKTEPENQAPSFDANIDTTLEVAENSAAGTNVGSPITATDPDEGDTLTYTLSGTDAASFEIGSSTGQITTKSGVTYDYETKKSYSVTVGVSDGTGGTDSIAVTVNLTDVNETPPAPTPPTANAGSDFNGKRGEVLTLSGSGTANADGSQTLTYRWRISGASHDELAAASAFLSSADSAEATFTTPRRKNMTDRSALDDGNWIDFELTVTDGDGEQATDTVRLTINGTTWTSG
ncbi:MAG: cadherin domain-containing protein [Chloroflexi bacterium]|nr:cadherin domain-containing protein [Chloroflexota bacterium]